MFPFRASLRSLADTPGGNRHIADIAPSVVHFAQVATRKGDNRVIAGAHPCIGLTAAFEIAGAEVKPPIFRRVAAVAFQMSERSISPRRCPKWTGRSPSPAGVRPRLSRLSRLVNEGPLRELPSGKRTSRFQPESPKSSPSAHRQNHASRSRSSHLRVPCQRSGLDDATTRLASEASGEPPISRISTTLAFDCVAASVQSYPQTAGSTMWKEPPRFVR